MIESVGGKALALNWDLADLNAIDGHVQMIENQLGPVDILINNTGGPPPTPASGQDPQLWQKKLSGDGALPHENYRSGLARDA